MTKHNWQNRGHSYIIDIDILKDTINVMRDGNLLDPVSAFDENDEISLVEGTSCIRITRQKGTIPFYTDNNGRTVNSDEMEAFTLHCIQNQLNDLETSIAVEPKSDNNNILVSFDKNVAEVIDGGFAFKKVYGIETDYDANEIASSIIAYSIKELIENKKEFVQFTKVMPNFVCYASPQELSLTALNKYVKKVCKEEILPIFGAYSFTKQKINVEWFKQAFANISYHIYIIDARNMDIPTENPMILNEQMQDISEILQTCISNHLSTVFLLMKKNHPLVPITDAIYQIKPYVGVCAIFNPIKKSQQIFPLL